VECEETDALLPAVRLRLRMVMLDGMPTVVELRGLARGGVLTGAGSFERADCTRCSRRCICAVRLRICVRPLVCDVDGGLDVLPRCTEGVA
jgi:hypothetical protein